MKNNIIAVIIVSAILGLSIGFNVALSFKLKKAMLTNVNTCDTIYKTDTLYNRIITIVPKPYKVVEVDSFLVFTKVDTMDIIGRYLAVNFYSDTLADSNLVAIIDQVVCENEIKSTGFKYSILLEPETIVKTDIDKQNGIYGGLISNYYDDKIGIGLSAGYLNKQGFYIGMSYDVIHKAPGIVLTKKIW